MTDIYSHEHQLNRIWRMRELRDMAHGEYRVAIAMARHIGVPVEIIARRAGITPDAIDTIVKELSNEDLIELAETELDWVGYRGGAFHAEPRN